MRDWLEKNKIFFETIAAISLSFMALFISCKQSEIAKNQLVLSEDPRIVIEPSDVVKGSKGVFELFVKNVSLAELYDIRIYEDYFVTESQENGTIGLVSMGAFLAKPGIIIPQLKPDKKEEIIANFESNSESAKEFYREHKGWQIRILRIKIKYCRKLDGKEFIKTKAYIIAGGDDFLIDYDERGIRTPMTPSFENIKNMLGVEN